MDVLRNASKGSRQTPSGGNSGSIFRRAGEHEVDSTTAVFDSLSLPLPHLNHRVPGISSHRSVDNHVYETLFPLQSVHPRRVDSAGPRACHCLLL